MLDKRSGKRLGRNYDEILEKQRLLTKDKLLDIWQGRGLIGHADCDTVLQLVGYAAQAERAFNRQRQAEGVAGAKAR
ncbi:hypothetical protein [Dysosmobacter sp.]